MLMTSLCDCTVAQISAPQNCCVNRKNNVELVQFKGLNMFALLCCSIRSSRVGYHIPSLSLCVLISVSSVLLGLYTYRCLRERPIFLASLLAVVMVFFFFFFSFWLLGLLALLYNDQYEWREKERGWIKWRKQWTQTQASSVRTAFST